MKSVLQDWVMEIPLRQQGVLVIALRGPDGVRKEDAAKPLIRTLRGIVMNSGREGGPMKMDTLWASDPFMTTYHISYADRWQDTVELFMDSWDSYNIHFLQHLAHAFAVCGIHHPLPDVRQNCWWFYQYTAFKLHYKPETEEEFSYRLRDGIREDQGEAS